MRRGPVLALGVSVVVALTACTNPHRVVRVFNDSGRPIILTAKGAGGEKIKLIRQGAAVLMNALWGEGALTLTAEDCAYSYRLAPMPMYYPFGEVDYRYPLNVQVEPDLTVHLLPWRTKAMVPTAELGKIARPGFPLKPFSKVCGSTTQAEPNTSAPSQAAASARL